MKRHPVIGDSLCGTLRLLKPVRPIVRHHHERWDGSGYPDRLKGDAIPLLAQITSVVDVYDALTTARVYRQPVSSDLACAEIREGAARGVFRPELVKEFIAFCSTGRLARLLSLGAGPAAFAALAGILIGT
jgi:putative two-component system response regulator